MHNHRWTYRRLLRDDTEYFDNYFMCIGEAHTAAHWIISAERVKTDEIKWFLSMQSTFFADEFIRDLREVVGDFGH